MKILRTISGALAVLALVLMVAFPVSASSDGKVFVCKYVGTPGEDERLQTGQNPISVSVNAIKDFARIGSYFNDAQGRSYVLAWDTGQPEPDVSQCPGSEQPSATPSPTATPTDSPTPTPSATPTSTPTATPSVTPTPSATPTATPVPTPTATPSATPTPTPTPEVTPTPTPAPTGSEPPAATGTPDVTPPPTDTVTKAPADSTGSMAGILFAIAGLVFFGSFLVPVRKPRR